MRILRIIISNLTRHMERKNVKRLPKRIKKCLPHFFPIGKNSPFYIKDRVHLTHLNLTSLHRHPPKKKKKTGKNSEYGYAFQICKNKHHKSESSIPRVPKSWKSSISSLNEIELQNNMAY